MTIKHPRLALIAASAVCILSAGTPLRAQDSDSDLVAHSAPSPGYIDEDRLILPEGTRLGFTLSQTLSSKKAKRGDLIQLTLRDDITHQGRLIVPAGSPAVGEVIRAQENGFMGRGGRLMVRMLYLDLANGPVRVSGPLGNAGKDQTALATAVTTATLGIVFFVKGKSAVIEEGTELDVSLDREARIPLTDANQVYAPQQ
ncbi:MAG: hypothetical protein AAGL10_08215 [Pseudomonadota bacterium]